MEIGLIALPTFSICNPAQKSSRQIKINNLPLEWPAKTPADRGKSVNGGRGDGWKDVLRKDVPLRGSGGNFLGFAVQQSAVGAEDIEFVQLMNEKDSRKVVRLFRRQTLPKM